MNTKKIFWTLIGMNIIQIILSVSIMVIMLMKNALFWEVIILVVALFAMINGLVTAISLYHLQNMRQNSLIESMKNLEQLNTTLRAQRHDYLNHIQVVYGLLELEEYEEAKKYMQPVFKEVSKVSMAMKTAQPAINALLQAKLQTAEKNDIDMKLQIGTDLKDIKIEAWELCKVLANIIDNGIAALNSKETDKELQVEMNEGDDAYQFRIINNGPHIPEAKLAKIFEKGYTTKTEDGHGMGLYIVKQIVAENGGSIQVISKEQYTCFWITFKKKK